jgi:hypothetical protein
LEETMSVMILDAGNSIIKAKIARKEQGEIVFPHAIRQLTETEYKNVMDRQGKAGNNQDYLLINGKPYVVGESAERHGVTTQRSGAARYTRDYYGVLAAAALGRLYERGRDVMVFGSHAPGDMKFRQDLMKAVIGDWDVEIGKRTSHFKVTYVNTFDEPLGGLMNVILTEDGQHYQHTDLNGGRSLVIDIGGFTTDWLAVNPGGEVDYGLARSVPLGIQTVIADFEESFRAHNLEAVKDTPIMPPERLRRAISSGAYDGGGRKYAFENEVKEATSLLLNRLADTYQRLAGGALSWDSIILTGGGRALLYNRLLPILNHARVILADQIESLHLAKVRGGMKLWRLYEALQIL